MENYSQVWTRMTKTASRGKLLCKTGEPATPLIGEQKTALLETLKLHFIFGDIFRIWQYVHSFFLREGLFVEAGDRRVKSGLFPQE